MLSESAGLYFHGDLMLELQFSITRKTDTKFITHLHQDAQTNPAVCCYQLTKETCWKMLERNVINMSTCETNRLLQKKNKTKGFLIMLGDQI